VRVFPEQQCHGLQVFRSGAAAVNGTATSWVICWSDGERRGRRSAGLGAPAMIVAGWCLGCSNSGCVKLGSEMVNLLGRQICYGQSRSASPSDWLSPESVLTP
jgi:hypothetical protein